MKKTYFAPEIESVKLNTISVIATSEKVDPTATGNGTVLSKEYDGGNFLWDDTAAE